MLSLTKVKLDLISDIYMYLLFEKCIKGGVSDISKRYSKANNKYLTSYNPKKQTKYNTYLNKKSYSNATSKSLPTCGL